MNLLKKYCTTEPTCSVCIHILCVCIYVECDIEIYTYLLLTAVVYESEQQHCIFLCCVVLVCVCNSCYLLTK